MLTILDVAKARGAQEDSEGRISMGELERLGLPFFGGCQTCGASIACYNAAPNANGYLSCNREECAPSPFETMEAYTEWEKAEDARRVAEALAAEEAAQAEAEQAREPERCWYTKENCPDPNCHNIH